MIKWWNVNLYQSKVKEKHGKDEAQLEIRGLGSYPLDIDILASLSKSFKTRLQEHIISPILG